jgi:hypothetical protein
LPPAMRQAQKKKPRLRSNRECDLDILNSTWPARNYLPLSWSAPIAAVVGFPWAAALMVTFVLWNCADLICLFLGRLSIRHGFGLHDLLIVLNAVNAHNHTSATLSAMHAGSCSQKLLKMRVVSQRASRKNLSHGVPVSTELNTRFFLWPCAE